MSDSEEESRPTVLLAGAANLVIGVAKLAAGLVSGSAAMLAEAAHSFADTLNQVFLLAALQRSRKPADVTHPFGYGMERYFWSLLAAVGIFVLGAGFAAYQGIEVLVSGKAGGGSPTLSYVVLAVAFVVEGISLARAVWQLRSEAHERGVAAHRHLLHDAEPAVRAVVFEDSVALLGVVLAAGGLALEHATGSAVWDGVASLLIAGLLVVVAFGLGQQNRDLLIGKAVGPDVQDGIAAVIRDADGIDDVLQLMTMRLAPDQVLVAARVDLSPGGDGDEFEATADAVDARIQERYPEVRHVFLDPTSPEP